jgi:hypothetical protein
MFDDIYLTEIGFTPGGSSTYLHTNMTQDTENGTYITIKKLGTFITIQKFKSNLSRLCELYPGICLTTEEKSRKNVS